MQAPGETVKNILATQLPQVEALRIQSRNLSELNIAGYVEAIAIDATGRCWLLGWLRDAMLDATAVLVLDGGAQAGAIALMRFARADLPAGSFGFIAALESGWRPGPASQQIVMLLGAPAGMHLRSTGERVQLLDMTSLCRVAEAAASSMTGAHAAALQALLFAPETLLPGFASPPEPLLDLAIDNIVAIPGVGCLVEGWALSRARQITGFTLTAGGATIVPDPRCSFRLPRPDLGAGFHRAAGTTGDAGFVQFFPVSDVAVLSQPLVLRIAQGRSVTTSHPLPLSEIQWLQRGDGEAALLRCYPALRHEPFFPALASVVKQAELTPRQRPVALKAPRAARALVLAIADHPDEPCRVIEDCLLWQDMARECGAGLVLMAPEAQRGRMLPLFRALERDPSCTAGLFFHAARHCRPADLVLVLDTIGAGSAVLLRDGYRTDRAAIAACLARLDEAADGAPPDVLQLAGDLAPAQARAEGPPAMVWTRTGFANLVRNGAAWADLPGGGAVLGAARRAIAGPPLRPMQQQLRQAGIWL